MSTRTLIAKMGKTINAAEVEFRVGRSVYKVEVRQPLLLPLRRNQWRTLGCRRSVFPQSELRRVPRCRPLRNSHSRYQRNRGCTPDLSRLDSCELSSSA